MRAAPHLRSSPGILVVGGGIFGLTAALELQARGHSTAVVDPGPLPHPDAASTDLSKVIRMEYGADATYMALMEEALAGWVRWNEAWSDPLYHETGVLMLTRDPMAPGGFEAESYRLLQARGHAPERLRADEISRRFPAWRPGAFVDGFHHARGGWAESGRVVARLVEMARRLGVGVHTGARVVALLPEGAEDRPVSGVRLEDGSVLHAGHTVLAMGAWTPLLLPELRSGMVATGHPVFHLAPENPDLFRPSVFPTFTADVARTGWYGFPLHPHSGVVKIANHGVGERLHPEQDPRVVHDHDFAALRAFLADTFPALVSAPVVGTRRCLYCDTADEHFWIDRHPLRPGLTVATGGSGHGFKFAPVLGGLVADAVEGRANPHLRRFQWRSMPPTPGSAGEEAARYRGA